MTRCPWPKENALMIDYHDREWGVPLRDPQELFAKLMLDGFQAGLSWLIVLRKREGIMNAFEQFDPQRIARWGPEKLAQLQNDPQIIRNRAKIAAAVTNARALLEMQERGQDFADFLWQFTGGAMKINRWRELSEAPSESAESRAMSKALKSAGFRFCGPTICYAFMQAVGMVNDHVVTCFRHAEVSALDSR